MKLSDEEKAELLDTHFVIPDQFRLSLMEPTVENIQAYARFCTFMSEHFPQPPRPYLTSEDHWLL